MNDKNMRRRVCCTAGVCYQREIQIGACMLCEHGHVMFECWRRLLPFATDARPVDTCFVFPSLLLPSYAMSSFIDLYDPLEIIGNGSFGIIRKVRRKTDGMVLLLNPSYSSHQLNFPIRHRYLHAKSSTSRR